MRLIINGQEQIVDNTQTVMDVMQSLGMIERKAAVAKNGHFIPRNAFDSTKLQDGDALEIITPMQGG